MRGDGCRSKAFRGEVHEPGQFCHRHRRESSQDGTGPDRLGDVEVGREKGDPYEEVTVEEGLRREWGHC